MFGEFLFPGLDNITEPPEAVTAPVREGNFGLKTGKGICPIDQYKPSSRPYPDRIPELSYPDDYQVRKVKCGGYIKLQGRVYYLSRQIIGDYVRLKPIGIDLWQLYFGRLILGIVDERLKSVIRPN